MDSLEVGAHGDQPWNEDAGAVVFVADDHDVSRLAVEVAR